jgi:copper chaperone CopZ
MASLKLSVAGMTCGHCRTTVEEALKAVPGTFGAAVFLEEGEAEVDYDANVASPDRFLAAVQQAGYQATVTD